MANVIFLGLCVLAGCGIVIQAAVNASLGRTTGLPSFATFLSFAIGIIPLFIYYAIESHGFNIGTYSDIKWWHFLGGILGAIYVFVITIAVPKLGASTVLSATIAGQVLLAIIVDHFALLDVEQRTANVQRIVATLMIVAGAILLALY